MPKTILKEHISIEQLILLHIYKKENQPTTIEELQVKLDLPRTTVVEKLNILERDGFVSKEKEGRVWQFYPLPEIAEKLYSALAQLRSAYIYALDHMRRNELSKIEEVKKSLEKEE